MILLQNLIKVKILKANKLIIIFLIAFHRTFFCFSQDTIVLPLDNIYERFRITCDSRNVFDSFKKNNCRGFIYDTRTDTIHFMVNGVDSFTISSIISKKDTGCLFSTYIICPGIGLNRFNFEQFKWFYKFGLNLSEDDKSNNVYFIKCFRQKKVPEKIHKGNDSIEIIRFNDLKIINLTGIESDIHLITFKYNTRIVKDNSFALYIKHLASLDSLLNRNNLEIEFFYFRFRTFSDEENFLELNRTIKIIRKLTHKYHIKHELFVIYIDKYDRKNCITDYYPVLQDTGLSIGVLTKKK